MICGQRRETRPQEGTLTSIVLLLLVVIAQITLPLGSHTTLGLLHLIGLVTAWLESLVCVEVL